MGPFGMELPLLSLGRFRKKRVAKMYTVAEIMKGNKRDPREIIGIIVSARGEKLVIFKIDTRGGVAELP